MIGDDFAPHLELFKHTLEIAGIMESRYIRMFSFFLPEGEDPSIYRDEVMGRWQRFIEAARGIGMTSRQRLWIVEIPLAAPVIIADVQRHIVAHPVARDGKGAGGLDRALPGVRFPVAV